MRMNILDRWEGIGQSGRSGGAQMRHKAVASSALVSVGYDPKSETLEIEFPSGHVYQYFGVSADAYKALMNADSIGSHFNAEIRDCYSCIRVQ
ncbi:MAG: KTSC domain-containing protein [Planctomycetota bacterium]